MIVRENIEFKRGEDPKRALDVGMYGKWFEKTSSDLSEYPDGYYLARQVILGDIAYNLYHLKDGVLRCGFWSENGNPNGYHLAFSDDKWPKDRMEIKKIDTPPKYQRFEFKRF